MGYFTLQYHYTHGGIIERKSIARGSDLMEPETVAESASAQHQAEAKRKAVNRLRRAHGQLAAVITAVEQDTHCRDIVNQLAAVSKALDRAGILIISSALKECLNDPASEGSAERDELERLFLILA